MSIGAFLEENRTVREFCHDQMRWSATKDGVDESQQHQELVGINYAHKTVIKTDKKQKREKKKKEGSREFQFCPRESHLVIRITSTGREYTHSKPSLIPANFVPD